MLKDYIKAIQQYIAPKYGLSLYAGFCANLKIKKIKNRLIRNFIQKYNVNMQEAERESIEQYSCFNDFFTRHLKPNCRTIADTSIVSPVDGYLSEYGSIKQGQLIQAKGKNYTAEELLATTPEIAAKFKNGYFATLYLSPRDYHRIHMPIAGTLKEMTYVPGKLFSVQPATVKMIPRLFARNERVVVTFETTMGTMAMVLVGAVIVGSIGTAWHGDLKRSRKLKTFTYSSQDTPAKMLQKAEEMGYFKLGSTVILLFSGEKPISWCHGLQPQQSIKLGDSLAELTQ